MKKESFAAGVSYMLLSATGIAVAGVFGKMGAPHLSLSALIFWRFLSATLMCIGVIGIIGKLHHLFTVRHLPLQVLRAGFVLSAQYSFYYYIQRDTLLNGMVLLNLGPLFIPFIEWLILRSKIGKSTWIAVSVSFVGMLFVLQPNSGIFSFLSFIGVLAGLCQGCSQVAFGFIAKNERTELSNLYNFVLCLFLSVIPYLFTAENKETASPLFLFGIIVGMGAASVVTQFARAWAYQHGTPSRLSTFLYFSILWGWVFDWAIFHNPPNAFSLIGALLVVAGGLLKIYLRAFFLKK